MTSVSRKTQHGVMLSGVKHTDRSAPEAEGVNVHITLGLMSYIIVMP